MSPLTLSLLSDAERDLYCERTLHVLDHVGAQFESPKARAVLAEGGCRVNEETHRVSFPRELVEWSISKLQREVLLAARDPQKDALLDGSRTYLTTAGISPYIVDEETGKQREPGLDDLARVGRIVDALDEVGIVWFPISPTRDAPGDTTDLVSFACLAANTSKHIQGECVRPEDVPVAIEMFRLASGDVSSSERPLFSSLYCPVSPLTHEAAPSEAGMALAAARVPIDIFTLPLSGGTAPMTLFGAAIQNTAETLSAAVLFKLVDEDCPLIFSANTGIMDMRRGSFASAAPEVMLMNIAQIELARTFHVPTLSVGCCIDVCDLGFAAGAEDAGYGIITRLARPDIMIGLGSVESGNALSLPKLVLDAELARHSDRLLAGIAIDEEHAQVEAITDVGPGGNFLEHEATLAYMRSGEHWVPDLLRRTPYAEWEAGAPREFERAAAKVREILATHEPLPLPEGAREAIDGLVHEFMR